MKHTVFCVALAISNLFGCAVWAVGSTAEATGHTVHDPSHVVHIKADEIVKKCVAKAMLIRDERICESKKSVIVVCLVEELRTKDMDKAQQVCEKNYIL